MRRLITYAVALTAAAVLATTAWATPTKCSVHQTGKVELACGVKDVRYGASGVRWYKHHRYIELQSKTQEQIHNELLARLWWERRGERWVRQARRRLAAAARPSFPPHHALWMCEYRHEASTAPGRWHNEDTGNNGHYGGLQMHWSWGYGIVGDPAHYSQLQQEWAAERGYAANGYSHTWLLGQWAHYDCLSYT